MVMNFVMGWLNSFLIILSNLNSPWLVFRNNGLRIANINRLGLNDGIQQQRRISKRLGVDELSSRWLIVCFLRIITEDVFSFTIAVGGDDKLISKKADDMRVLYNNILQLVYPINCLKKWNEAFFCSW